MLRYKIGLHELQEFKHKLYAGRVFKLTGTSLVFQIHPNYGIRFWTIGHGTVIQERELNLIIKVVERLKKEQDN